jgi:hypothetical protein
MDLDQITPDPNPVNSTYNNIARFDGNTAASHSARRGCGEDTGGSKWKRSSRLPDASQRRQDLLSLLDRLNPTIC